MSKYKILLCNPRSFFTFFGYFNTKRQREGEGKMASEEDNQPDDVVSIELPAPSGWTKKVITKKGSTPKRKDIVFTSPTGEEVKSKAQLQQYLKSHAGGPAASEFYWGTGDTPRRSSRLSEKTKADDVTLLTLSPKKRQKGTSSKQAQEKSSADAEEAGTSEKDTAAEEAKEDSTIDAKDAVDDATPGKSKSEDGEKKTDTEAAPEEASAAAPVSTITENLNASAKLEESMVDESKEAPPMVADTKNDETEGATNAGKGTPDEKVETAVQVSDNHDCSKEKEAEEKGDEKDP